LLFLLFFVEGIALPTIMPIIYTIIGRKRKIEAMQFKRLFFRNMLDDEILTGSHLG